MTALVTRSLVLACGLVLAFPPGWCCLLPVRKVETTPEPLPGACCHHRRAEHPHQPAGPTPPLKVCCCSALPTPLPSGVEKAPPDVGVSFVLPFPGGDGPGASDRERVGQVLFPSPPLRLLQCVWRC